MKKTAATIAATLLALTLGAAPADAKDITWGRGVTSWKTAP